MSVKWLRIGSSCGCIISLMRLVFFKIVSQKSGMPLILSLVLSTTGALFDKNENFRLITYNRNIGNQLNNYLIRNNAYTI